MPEPDPAGNRRPLPITIVAWLSIALGVFYLITYGLAGYLLLVSSESQAGLVSGPGAFLGWSVSPAAFWTLVLVVPLILVFNGLFLLRGSNRARLVAMFWWIFSFLSLFYTYGFNTMTFAQAGFCLLVVYFLNTGMALRFFKGGN